MQTPSTIARPVSAAAWAGCALSTLATAFFAADAGVHLLAPELIRAPMEAGGFAFEHAGRIGALSLACAALYALPHTAFLGAILATGFLGGAIGAHLRLGELGSPPQLLALAVGAMTWGGLYLRDPRLRALLPITGPGRAPSGLARGEPA